MRRLVCFLVLPGTLLAQAPVLLEAPIERVRLHPDDRVSAANIEHLPIAVSGANMVVPLDQIANITMGKGPAQINHTDGKRAISVSANAQGRSPGEVTADAMKIARAMVSSVSFIRRLSSIFSSRADSVSPINCCAVVSGNDIRSLS